MAAAAAPTAPIVGVQELNAFGYGAAVTVGRTTNVDRTQNGVRRFSDANIDGSRIGGVGAVFD